MRKRLLATIRKSSREVRAGSAGPAAASSPTVLAPASAPAVPHAVWLSLIARVGEAVRSAPWGAPLAASPTDPALCHPRVIFESRLVTNVEQPVLKWLCDSPCLDPRSSGTEWWCPENPRRSNSADAIVLFAPLRAHALPSTDGDPRR